MTETPQDPTDTGTDTEAETQDQPEPEGTTNPVDQQDDADLAVDQAPVVDVPDADDEPQ